MKIFSIARKKIKNCIFTEEFDQEWQDATAKAVFVMYCLNGGFCFHNYVHEKFRKIWITFNIFNLLWVYASCLFYFMNVPKENYYVLICPPVPAMSGLLTKIGVYISTYFMKDALTKILSFLNRRNQILHTNLSDLKPSTTEKETHISLSKINAVAFGCFLLVIVTSASGVVNIDKYLKSDDYIIHMYPMYVPFDKPASLRFVVKFIQITTILPELVILIVYPAMIVTIVVSVYDCFVSLSLFIQDASQSLEQNIDEVFKLEQAIEEKQIPSSLSKTQEVKIKKTLAFDEFNGKIIRAVKQHQDLYSIAKLYADEMDLIYSLAYMNISMTSIIGTFYITLIPETEQEFYESMTIIIVVLQMVSSWFVFCFIGESFQKMNSMIVSEVYNSPWYYLEPKDRRFVLTFLTLAQRSITIVVCRRFSAELCVFPDLLETIYNQVQILRTLQFNKQKRHN